MNIKIRQEFEKEYKRAEEVVKQAFSHETFSDQKEHELVNRIRKSDAFIPELSLVAVDKEIIGHVLLSKIKIVNGDKSVDSLALAPVSVAPDYQKKGIGSLLISNVLREAKELGYHSIIVLGHKEYYPKFGFKSASLWNIRAPFEVPDEVFMAMELTENALQNVQGVVQYSEAFSE
ncbi:N-acetyltransferase [Bacillus cereus]|uniref:GNAT family N-acetyltransferase n=1 Tax=unclassified Bacillus (in: firmicutes) TaxID=185979 RepID=UPI00047C9356|nr:MULTISPECIES: N-acetyltransferase [unclassified Bacillus (in: firmicutes)]PFE04949.1 N-acetyltransferase [Bacillus sp. AFS023182]PGX99156.1 N-acetyltransferase [Bacillus cereus]